MMPYLSISIKTLIRLKNLFLFILLLLFIQQAHSQDFWGIVSTPSNIDIRSMQTDNDGNLYIGSTITSGGGLYKSNNNGLMWELLGFEEQGVGLIEINNLGYIYAFGGDGFPINRSIDLGQTWEILYESIQGGGILKSFNDSILYASTGTASYVNLIKSTNYGDNWEELLIFPSNMEYPYDIVIQNKDTLYIGTTKFTGDGGGVYRTIDGGTTWGHIGLLDHYVSSLAMNSNGDLFAGTRGHATLGGGGVFILNNGQNNWVNLSDDELVTSIAINSNDDVFIGCSTHNGYLGGVQKSNDNGQSWEQLPTEIMSSSHIEDIMIDMEDYLYAKEENSLTPLYRSINTTITTISEYPIDKDIITYNFPNPFIKETTIFYSLSTQKTNCVDIVIYNALGTIVERRRIPNSSNKDNKIKFIPQKLGAGIYYYKVIAGNSQVINKMVLQK